MSGSPVDRLRTKFLVGAGSAFLSLLVRSLRIEQQGLENLEGFRSRGQPIIIVCWHAWILPMAHVHRNEGIVVLVSRHGDGELIAQLVERWGYGTARGSSTRGGVAGLKGLVRAARSGHDLAITPDGPRGPGRRVKPGVIVAGQLTRCPLVPLVVGADAMWRVNSWDRMVVPRPGTRLRVRYGEPLSVPRQLDDGDLEEYTRILDNRMNELTDSVAGPDVDPTRPDGPWTPDAVEEDG